MLRITIHESLEFLTFQLEGKLAGAWVREWSRNAGSARSRAAAGWPFALTWRGVTFIDAAGKTYLADMHRPRGRVFCCRLPDQSHRGRDYNGGRQAQLN